MSPTIGRSGVVFNGELFLVVGKVHSIRALPAAVHRWTSSPVVSCSAAWRAPNRVFRTIKTCRGTDTSLPRFAADDAWGLVDGLVAEAINVSVDASPACSPSNAFELREGRDEVWTPILVRPISCFSSPSLSAAGTEGGVTQQCRTGFRCGKCYEPIHRRRAACDAVEQCTALGAWTKTIDWRQTHGVEPR